MNNSDYLGALRRDGQAFATAVTAVDLNARVPSCPDWNVADLLWHLGEVLYFWRCIVEQRATSYEQVVALERMPDAELVGNYTVQLQRLLEVLGAADPATPVWTWSDQNDVAFVVRRMAQETAVHVWDARQAAGFVEPIDAELASDGIDEFLFHFADTRPAAASIVGGSVHIHCTDIGGEWTLMPGSDGSLAVTREHAKGDCALRGAASDLLLVLWRRVGLDSVDVVGDQGVAARFVAATRLE